MRLYNKNDNRQQRQIDEGGTWYEVIRNLIPRWLGQGLCTANEQDSQIIEHYQYLVAQEPATASGTNPYIYITLLKFPQAPESAGLNRDPDHGKSLYMMSYRNLPKSQKNTFSLFTFLMVPTRKCYLPR